jgi:DNA-directed RNA polymerase subunit P
MSLFGEFENMRGVTYACVRCGKRFDGDEIADRQDLKCPDCGFRVIKKVKPPVAKRVKAT